MFVVSRAIKKGIYKQLASRCIVSNKYSTDNKSPSYVHRLGTEPLKFLNVGQLLKLSSVKYKDREALVSCSEGSRITFSETIDKVDRLASGLLRLGLQKGDNVAIWAPNYEFWYISMLAIARAGLICVALNPAYQLPELDYCLKKVGIKAIIAPESFRKQKHYEMLATLIPDLRNSQSGLITNNTLNSLKCVIINSKNRLAGTVQYDDLITSSSESDMAEIEKLQSSISPDLGCNIQFTSGTTGKSKAALISHFSMVNNGNEIGKRQELDKIYCRILVNNPLFHAYGIVIAVMNALNHGATLVLPSPHFNPTESLKVIAKEKCNVIYGTPTMFVDLVSKQREINVDLPEIFFANTGGAICTAQLVKDIENVLKAKRIRSIYGLTELTASVFQSLPPDQNDDVQEYVGCIGDHLEAKVIDVDGKTVPFGEPGELCIRGYSTMLEYFDDKEKTKEILDTDKWLKTGDQFVLTTDGIGKVVGRLKEMIIRGGENLFPREIEDFLNTHPNIKEAHVIGIPDERMGEEVGALISLKDNTKSLTKDEVKEFCKGKLSHFKVPRYIITVDEFPRTVSGKVQKFKFLDMFADKLKHA